MRGGRLADGRLGCLITAFGALLLAFVFRTVPLERPVYNLIFVVDITRSMNAEDYALDRKPVSRLVFVKEALRQVAKGLPCQSQVGLGLFSERRVAVLFEPVEVCANFSALEATLKALDWHMAWAADSHIAHGLLSALELIKGREWTLVFLTDGHEAPPLNPRYRPDFEGVRGEVKGLIVGVGDLTLVPIPKFDERGNAIGFYAAEEVPHASRFGLPSEDLSRIKGYDARNAPFGSEPALGTEHLTSVREAYLKELASETGLAYHRLENAEGLSKALRAGGLAKYRTVAADIRWVPASAALGFLLLAYGVLPWTQRFR